MSHVTARLALALITLAVPVVAADGPVGKPAVPLLRTGDFLTGGLGDVGGLEDIALPPSGNLILASGTFEGSAVLINGQPVLGTGMFIPALGQAIWGLSSAGDLDAQGRHVVVITYLVDEFTGHRAVLLDGVPVLDQGDAVELPGHSPQTTWGAISTATFDAGGDLVVSGSVIDPQSSAAADKAVVRYELDAAGAIVGATPLLVTGEAVGDGVAINLSTDLQAQVGVGPAGSVFIPAVIDVTGSGSAPFQQALVLDGVPVVAGGEPSPIPGRDWWVSALVDTLDLAEDGSWAAVTSVSNGTTIGNRVIVRDGALWATLGGAVPGRPGTAITLLYGLKLSNTGNMFWAAQWLEGGVQRRAFLLNDQILIEEGVSVTTDGHVLTQLATTPYGGMTIAPDGSRVGFRALQDDGRWGVYVVYVGPWVSQGASLADGDGVPPQLVASGSLQAGSQTSLEVRAGVPFGTAAVVLGLSELAAPFKGGVILPAVDVLVTGLPLDGAGVWSLGFPWPAGIPSGLPTYWQGWIVDPSGPAGFTATNALLGTTQ